MEKNQTATPNDYVPPPNWGLFLCFHPHLKIYFANILWLILQTFTLILFSLFWEQAILWITAVRVLGLGLENKCQEPKKRENVSILVSSHYV